MSVPPSLPGLAARLEGTPLVVMLDVDGTLAPIAPRPEDAAVPPETRRAVAALAARDGVHVALVSGRAAADARRMVSVSNVWVVGNHGAEVLSPSGDEEVDPRVEAHAHAIAQAARRIAQLVAQVPGVVLEDKRWTLSVHYRLADPAVAPRLRRVLEDVVTPLGLRITEGKMIYEVRPPVQVDKGTAVLALAERLGADGAEASLFFAGDDRTDEDAFRLLRRHIPNAVTVRVNEEPLPGGTAAEFELPGPPQVRELLEWLAAARR